MILTRNNKLFFLVLISFALSCKKETKTTSDQSQEMVKDIDGNSYNTVKIGNQIWLKENLKVTKFRDGTPLINGKNTDVWSNTLEGAYLSYKNDSTFIPKYGLLYNWYAIVDPKCLCPVGWHSPSKDEWDILFNFVGGGPGNAGLILKSKQEWDTTYYNGNYPKDNFGFSMLPAGYRRSPPDLAFEGIGSDAKSWTTSVSADFPPYNEPYMVSISRFSPNYISYLNFWGKGTGCSVRCIKD